MLIDHMRRWLRLMEEDESDYRGQHQAPMQADGAPAYDVTLNGIYPEDFYSPAGFRYYADTGEVGASNSFGLVQRLHNRPNARLSIYRAVPKGGRGINRGDWVAISRGYAVDHGRSNLNGSYSLLTRTVAARDLFTDGNSICEWGYDPQPFDVGADKERIRRRQERIAAMDPESRRAYYERIAKYMTPDERRAYMASVGYPDQ